MNLHENFPRFVEERLMEALRESPVVIIHGPRQSGKTTLAQRVGDDLDYRYLTFDDDVVLGGALADPIGFVADLPDRVILDEVQRAPQLFTTLKAAVDRARTPGRFLLTGSANVLLLPRLSESLAGRLELLRLHPLAQCEIRGRDSRFLDQLFRASFETSIGSRLGDELIQRVVAGGYPAALGRTTPRRRAIWYRDYITALVQRDVRDISNIRSLDALPRLLTLAAGQTGRLLNISDLAAPFQLSRPTIRDYFTLLEGMFLLEQLQPWHSNRLSRLVKAPKLHLTDSGLSCALLGVDEATLASDRPLFGQLLETFVFQELRRMASWSEHDTRFFHYRDRDGVEVDVVVERGARQLAGVEVKAGATVRDSDFRGLRKLQESVGQSFVAGAVVYDGDKLIRFGDRLFAVPLSTL